MGMKKNLCRGIGSWSLPVLLSVFLFASCKDDLQTSVHTGPGIRFSVSDRADWHATRVVGSPEEETAPRDSLLGYYPCRRVTEATGSTCTPCSPTTLGMPFRWMNQLAPVPLP